MGPAEAAVASAASRAVTSTRAPLLEQVRGLLERTYDHATGLGPLAPFLIGDAGYRRLLGNRRSTTGAGSADGDARLLIRSRGDGPLRVCLYFPDRLIRVLERQPPSRDLHGGNVDAFATFVEEIDHLLLLAARAPAGPDLTLLEMELHANVSKELVLRHFLARLSGVTRLPRSAIVWLRHHLFYKHEYSDPDEAVRGRYQDAARLALRYLSRLEKFPTGQRLVDLRRFSRMSHHQKLELIRRAT